ncbi:MAG: dihydropteroate synthase [Gemmataceae bacterium]|nr:dihydropteroate synthase [Gemmataceae bacterium]
MVNSPPRILFVTGKLAEPALRRVLADLGPKAGVAPEVAVLNITVAALMTANWVARHLSVPAGVERVVLPGLCRGDVEEVARAAGVPAVLGPNDLRDLPEFFGGKPAGPPPGYGGWDIEILAEVNHAPKKGSDAVLAEARHYRGSGADVIDLGCDPGGPWPGVGEAVRMLRAEGFRVSVDSFDPVEVGDALAAGAELVLSVNGTNVDHARGWHERHGAEVVAIPDTPTDFGSLERTAEQLARWGVRFRLDPVLEPIGFGFAASLGRYIEARRRWPDAELMMGVGNLTELTEVDSAGVNVLLAGFCQELGIRSVLTTEVINWGRTAVKEFDLARRLVYHAVREKVLPKRLDPSLVMLRDPKLYPQGEAALAELAARVTDRNYRIFAERGGLHILNGTLYLRGTDPFAVFARLVAADPKLDASHAFYLGYEFAKAVTALTLGKAYTQDRPLRWGFLTVPEAGHRHPDSPSPPPPPGVA